MTSTRWRRVLRSAMLAAGILCPLAAVALDVPQRSDVSSGFMRRADGARMPWPAPVGHRQPRADEIPASRREIDAGYERKERALARRLNICRGC